MRFFSRTVDGVPRVAYRWGMSKGTAKKTTTIELYAKEPDQFGDMSDELKLSEATRRKFLDCGEYATIELVVDEYLHIVGGKFLPVKR